MRGSRSMPRPNRTPGDEPGSVVHTEGWQGYASLRGKGYAREVTALRPRPETASQLLPRVHRVVSLMERWLLGTHQGAVSHEHLNYHLDEFTHRLNRTTSRHRGKLFHRLPQQAVTVAPSPYRETVKHTRGAPSRPTTARRGYLSQGDTPFSEDRERGHPRGSARHQVRVVPRMRAPAGAPCRPGSRRRASRPRGTTAARAHGEKVSLHQALASHAERLSPPTCLLMSDEAPPSWDAVT